MPAVHCCCFPSSLRKWVRPGVAVGNPRALTGKTPWRWMRMCSSLFQPEKMTIMCLCMQGIATHLFRQCVRVPLLLGIPKCACLRNGWSAKTMRRISASINLITTQELFYAINMFGTCFDRKECNDPSCVNRTLSPRTRLAAGTTKESARALLICSVGWCALFRCVWCLSCASFACELSSASSDSCPSHPFARMNSAQ